jgi:hypothetical protein
MTTNLNQEVTGKGRIQLTNESFENVLHVPKLSVNIISMYQMMNYVTGNKLIFTPNVKNIYDMKTNSRVATSEVNINLDFIHFMNLLNQILPYFLPMLRKVVGYGMKCSGI